MNNVNQGNIGNDGRQKGVLDDFDIGDAHILHHQKCRRAHDRRHQLAIGGAGHFHGPGFFRLKARPFSSAGW